MKQLPLETERPVWQAPKLQELGNLHRFVRAGGISGKSTFNMDGETPCSNEGKNGPSTCNP